MDELYDSFDGLIAQYSGDSALLAIFLKFLAVFIIALALWLIFLFILSIVVKSSKKLESITIGDHVIKLAKKLFLYILIILAGTYLIRSFNAELAGKIFYAVIIIFLAGPLMDFIKIFLSFLQKNIAAKTETNVDDILFDLLNKFIGAIVYITAIIIALDLLGINIMPFIAGASVAGVAVGFAAKDTLSNLIAGVLLLIDRPFEVGDRIEIWSAPRGSATWGDVAEIGLRATKIQTTDHITIIIPNNEIMMRDIVNYTIGSPVIRVRINIGVAFDSDIKKAKEIIIERAKALDWCSQEKPPKVVVKQFGESSVDLQLRIWITNARKRRDTISIITDTVKEAFDEAGIEIPYPKRDVTIIHKNMEDSQ